MVMPFTLVLNLDPTTAEAAKGERKAYIVLLDVCMRMVAVDPKLSTLLWVLSSIVTTPTSLIKIKQAFDLAFTEIRLVVL